MAGPAFTILNPMSETTDSDVVEIRVNPLPATTGNLRMALVGNAKPNVEPLFLGIKSALEVASGIEGRIEIREFDKGSPAIPVPAAMLTEILAWSDVVLAAIADCGSCTSWTVHDAAEIERSGKPAVVITTDRFSELVRLEAAALGVPELRFVELLHPLSGIPADRAVERGEDLSKTVAHLLGL